MEAAVAALAAVRREAAVAVAVEKLVAATAGAAPAQTAAVWRVVGLLAVAAMAVAAAWAA